MLGFYSILSKSESILLKLCISSLRKQKIKFRKKLLKEFKEFKENKRIRKNKLILFNSNLKKCSLLPSKNPKKIGMVTDSPKNY